MIHYIREDETGGQDFALSDQNGSFNGTGSTITILLRDRSGADVNTTGKVAWLVAASGTVRVLPALGDLKADNSPYSATFLVSLSGLTYAFPSQKPDVWQVWK
jgi:hypothetical protein